jgi:hypothetical protein
MFPGFRSRLAVLALAATLVGPQSVMAAPLGQGAPDTSAPAAAPPFDVGASSAPVPVSNATRCADGAITFATNPEQVCAEHGGVLQKETMTPP